VLGDGVRDGGPLVRDHAQLVELGLGHRGFVAVPSGFTYGRPKCSVSPARTMTATIRKRNNAASHLETGLFEEFAACSWFIFWAARRTHRDRSAAAPGDLGGSRWCSHPTIGKLTHHPHHADIRDRLT
jgi:hypothetical protein